jgi:hypothetical protein
MLLDVDGEVRCVGMSAAKNEWCSSSDRAAMSRSVGRGTDDHAGATLAAAASSSDVRPERDAGPAQRSICT